MFQLTIFISRLDFLPEAKDSLADKTNAKSSPSKKGKPEAQSVESTPDTRMIMPGEQVSDYVITKKENKEPYSE
jgi:hypothetical protein